MPKELTKDQQTTLLYLETRLVDFAGRVNGAHLNASDRLWIDQMKEEKFLDFGRIVIQHHNRDGSAWVTFSDEAWELAHKLRRERADRMFAQRTYSTTREASSHV